ncbi:MAG: hypothetical protein WC686_04615 [Candidatus Shapirobacteria bacterium]|jgi:hypothetical protein
MANKELVGKGKEKGRATLPAVRKRKPAGKGGGPTVVPVDLVFTDKTTVVVSATIRPVVKRIEKVVKHIGPGQDVVTVEERVTGEELEMILVPRKPGGRKRIGSGSGS